MEAELQKFRQNQDEEGERFSCSQHHRRGYHQQRPPHYHIQPQLDLDHLNEWSDSEFEVMAEPPSQHYKQQPRQLDQLTDAGETSSNEECEWGFCLVTRQNQHLSEADLLIPLFKKNLSFDEFSEWVTEVERFFEFYEIPEDEQVEFVAYRLEEQAFSWWELIQNLNRRFNKQPIKEWTEMKEMLMARFLDINCFVTEEYQSSHAES
ncbi:unnamed protein product [Lactuca virosa]|uniref:Retrotransposon gag domain-containing protein n=1 Tax=Lactuca virosa TaxID=75947 RepID=A0AAU9P813_9ASTR|nr:unnamed protein product [Lactuca virosa]